VVAGKGSTNGGRMWGKPSVHLLFLGGLIACGSSRSEEVVKTPPPSVAADTGVTAVTTDTGVTAVTTDTGVTARTTDTVVTTRTIVDTSIVTVDTTITGVDTTFTVDTTTIKAGRGEIVDTTR
jgi:hypothetical protein